MNEADTFEDIPSSSRITLDDVAVLPPEMNELPQASVGTESGNQFTSTGSSNNEVSHSLNIDIEVFDRIANKLLKSGLFLTALELHAELVERGKELPRLREYFDDPKNFEKCIDNTASKKQEYSGGGINNLLVPRSLTPHTASEQTFDSLDFTHYSDDDIERQGDERIAVLEFELRKSHQTINSLRACLTISQTGQLPSAEGTDFIDVLSSTKSADGKSVKSSNDQLKMPSQSTHRLAELDSFLTEPISSRDFYQRGSADGDSCPGEDDKFTRTNQTLSDSVGMFEHGQESSSLKYSLASSIKPLEKRAINFLINEYLLANNYKLTSNTFCDEDADQDFDKWDDVGLNIDRPPDLLKLYRYHWQNHCPTSLMRTLSNATTIVNANTNHQSSA